MRPPHLCSLYPLFLEVLGTRDSDNGEVALGTATGFLYQHDGFTYLITNWHVLSGLHTQKLTAIDTWTSLLPTSIRVRFPVEPFNGNFITETYHLIDDHGQYLWLEHPLSHKVDVAALRIDPPSGIATFETNESFRQIGLCARDDFFFVTQEVWVIGFPKAVTAGGLPIWKRATIAADPCFSSANQKHKILLDTATRDGMSGSPVLYVNNNLSRLGFDNRAQEVDFPSAKLMLGVYSGRIAGDDELSAQLGIAWGAEAVEELVQANKIYVPT